MSETQNVMRYSIDSSDEIVSVCGEWNQFASKNDAPQELFSQKVLHSSIWDWISGDATAHTYRKLLGKVREGKTITLPVRCDSPRLRRFLTLNMAPIAAGGVKFLAETVSTEDREFQPLFCAHADRIIEIVITCSWCNKIKIGENVWQECEDAVRTLGLFESEAMPSLSHGMCEECYRSVISKL